MGLGPASRGLNDVTTETRVFRQQVSQLPEMSSVLFASAWVTLARPLAAPRCGSLSESSAARAVRTGRGAQRRDRGVRAPGASESGRGAAVRPRRRRNCPVVPVAPGARLRGAPGRAGTTQSARSAVLRS